MTAHRAIEDTPFQHRKENPPPSLSAAAPLRLVQISVPRADRRTRVTAPALRAAGPFLTRSPAPEAATRAGQDPGSDPIPDSGRTPGAATGTGSGHTAAPGPVSVSAADAESARHGTHGPAWASAAASPSRNVEATHEAQQGVTAQDTATARSLAVSVIEVLYGLRRPEQISRWVAPEVMERIARHVEHRRRLLRGRPEQPTTVRAGSVIVQRSGPERLEASVVVHTTIRVRAVSMQLIRRGSRWRVATFLTA